MNSRAEFEATFQQHWKVDQSGPETIIHFPCPGCAAPDFIVTAMLKTRERMALGATCIFCQRGFRTVYEERGDTLIMEVVQTHGPDVPEFLPTMRRLS